MLSSMITLVPRGTCVSQVLRTARNSRVNASPAFTHIAHANSPNTSAIVMVRDEIGIYQISTILATASPASFGTSTASICENVPSIVSKVQDMPSDVMRSRRSSVGRLGSRTARPFGAGLICRR